MSPRRNPEADWRMVRLPKALAERIDRIADQMLQSHIEGRSQLPNDQCERVAKFYVIERALDELEGKKERSRRSKRKPSGDAVADTESMLSEFRRSGM